MTTYANLNRLNQQHIDFITLRRRPRNLLREAANARSKAWRGSRCAASPVSTSTRILNQRISLPDYQGWLRQLIITDLGHEQPTFLLTNQLKRSAAKLIGRYAQRMLIENNIQDGVDFFHMDALSSAVALKVNCDLQLTLMASSLYRMLAAQMRNGYENAKSRHLFAHFVDASAVIDIGARDISVHFQKRAHNPYLLGTGFDKTAQPIPWLGGKRLHLVFG